MNRNEVEKLNEGLLYMSEMDASLKYFELDDEAARQLPPTTATQLPELIGKESKTPAGNPA